jgi:hypothetical protein
MTSNSIRNRRPCLTVASNHHIPRHFHVVHRAGYGRNKWGPLGKELFRSGSGRVKDPLPEQPPEHMFRLCRSGFLMVLHPVFRNVPANVPDQGWRGIGTSLFRPDVRIMRRPSR